MSLRRYPALLPSKNLSLKCFFMKPIVNFLTAYELRHLQRGQPRFNPMLA